MFFFRPRGRLYRIKRKIYFKTAGRNTWDPYNVQLSQVAMWTGVLFGMMLLLRSLYLKFVKHNHDGDSSESIICHVCHHCFVFNL
ncbi:hypothetical protein MSG28_006586 [Choristoneura fumiferana]|uniref:Uncharacterized protein n=1 Tax=Choristoneura fumiferana TaxID=7141 RepID=A0ACC0JFK0_CHOFU|nr:hypothetical protein MSG28_006586 [Choristoneura fumiferana]